MGSLATTLFSLKTVLCNMMIALNRLQLGKVEERKNNQKHIKNIAFKGKPVCENSQARKIQRKH